MLNLITEVLKNNKIKCFYQMKTFTGKFVKLELITFMDCNKVNYRAEVVHNDISLVNYNPNLSDYDNIRLRVVSYGTPEAFVADRKDYDKIVKNIDKCISLFIERFKLEMKKRFDIDIKLICDNRMISFTYNKNIIILNLFKETLLSKNKILGLEDILLKENDILNVKIIGE